MAAGASCVSRDAATPRHPEGRSAFPLTYGLKSGLVVHISQVERGARCGCLCQRCNGILIAKKGRQRLHHFAHQADTSCDGAAETALHKAAVEAFHDLSELRLPAYVFQIRRRLKDGRELWAEEPLLPAADVRLDSSELTPRVGSIVPDILVRRGGRSLCVEIVVTHDADRAKERQLRRMRLPAIRIRLEPQDGYLSPEALRNKLRDDVVCKSWIYHPKQGAVEAVFLKRLRQEQRELRQFTFEVRRVRLARHGSLIERWRKYVADQNAATRASWDSRPRSIRVKP